MKVGIVIWAICIRMWDLQFAFKRGRKTQKAYDEATRPFDTNQRWIGMSVLRYEVSNGYEPQTTLET